MTRISLIYLLNCVSISLSSQLGFDFPAEAAPKVPYDVTAAQNSTYTSILTDHTVRRLKSVKVKGDKEIVLGLGVNHFSILTNTNRDNSQPIIVDWEPDQNDIKGCEARGKTNQNCQNHILMAEEVKRNTILVCGTNADNPSCQYYNITQDKRKDVESVEPTLSEPIPGHHLTGGAVATESFLSHFAESSKQLYIATESTKLRRIPMAQSATNHNTLRSMPLSFSSNGKIDFIKIIETNKKIYIFFTEISKLSGKLVSRVATICNNDEGETLDHYFTTFVKAKIECPVNDEFSFRRLTSVSSIFSMNGEESILATFVETNGIPGSAVCGFKLSDIEETLKSDFSTPTGIAPWHYTEHPAGCPGPEITKNRAYVRYMLDNEPIVEKSVPIISQEPLLTRTVFASFSERDLFTEIKVQNPEKIESKAEMEKTLVLIGTSRSKLLRATLNLKESAEMGGERTLELLSEQSLVGPCGPMSDEDLGLSALTINYESWKIIGYQDKCVMSVPLTLCGLFKCKEECNSAGDPNCNFDDNIQKCNLRTEDDVITEVSEFQKCPKIVIPPKTSVPPTTTTTTPATNSNMGEIRKNEDADNVINDETDNDDVISGPNEAGIGGASGSWQKTTYIAVLALVIGLILGAIMVVFCKKFRNTNQKDDVIMGNDVTGNGDGDEVTRNLFNSRHDSHIYDSNIYTNHTMTHGDSQGGAILNSGAAPRIHSTGSDSSADSGFIRASGDHTNVHLNFESATTGRVKPRSLKLSVSNYNTIGGNGIQLRHGAPSSATTSSGYNKQFGSMKYATTASSTGLNELDRLTGPSMTHNSMNHNSMMNHNHGLPLASQTKPRLGSSSLQYSTLQTRSMYTRQQSAPASRQNHQQKFAASPTKQSQSNYYNSIRKGSSSEQQWNAYKLNDASHYATLPKGTRQARIKRTPSTNNTLQNTKLIPVPTPTLDQLPASNLFSTKAN